jgi:hypothetical protein
MSANQPGSRRNTGKLLQEGLPTEKHRGQRSAEGAPTGINDAGPATKHIGSKWFLPSAGAEAVECNTQGSRKPMSLITVIVTIIVVGVLLYLVNAVIPMDPKVRVVLQIVVVLCLIFWLLDVFGIYNLPFRLRR